MFQKLDLRMKMRGATALVCLTLLLTACGAPAAQTPAEGYPAAPTSSIPTVSPEESYPVVVETEGPQSKIMFAINGIAENFTAQKIEAVSAGENTPARSVMPGYDLVTLTGYTVDQHKVQPQVYLIPVAELTAANPDAGQVVSALGDLLASKQPGETMPFLPLSDSKQAFFAQVKYLDFQGGKGVRYVTQFNQGPVPVNNFDLIYTFQGLTDDGAYYVAAVLPLNLAGLSADETIVEKNPGEFMVGYMDYIDKMTAMIEKQGAEAFTPDIEKIDTMIRSIVVK